MRSATKKIFAAMAILILLLSATLTGCKDLGGSSQPSESDIKGEWTDGVYANKFFNLKFTLPEGWNAASDEEILEIMNLGSELLDDKDNMIQEMLKQKQIYNMMAADPTTGVNVSVVMENLALTVGGTSYDAQEYADFTAEQLEAIEELNYTASDSKEVELAGETYVQLPMSVEISGISMEQAYYLRKLDKYMVCIIVTDTAGVGIDTLSAYFEAYSAQ